MNNAIRVFSLLAMLCACATSRLTVDPSRSGKKLSIPANPETAQQTSPQAEGDSEKSGNQTLLPLVALVHPFDRLQLAYVLASAGLVIMPNGSAGTGICVHPKQILTAYHVVKDESRNEPLPIAIMVFFKLHESGALIMQTDLVKLSVVRVDENNDLALYKIEDQKFSCRVMPRSDQQVKLHELVNRFGFNAGWMWTHGAYRGRKTLKISIRAPSGQIINKVFSLDEYEMPDGPGASGGPIVSKSGMLLGIVTIFGSSQESIVTNSRGLAGFRYDHLVYAVPLLVIQKFLQGQVSPPVTAGKNSKAMPESEEKTTEQSGNQKMFYRFPKLNLR